MEATDFFRKTFAFIFGEEKLNHFEEKLLLNNSFKGKFDLFLLFCVGEGIAFLIGAMFLLFYINLEIDKKIILVCIVFFVPFLLNYLWQDIKFEKRKKKKEELLPELLLEASVFYDNNSLLKNIEKLAQIDLPLLNEDFERVLVWINNGSSVTEALFRMKRLNKSKNIDRVVDLLLQGYESGIEMNELLKETAEDLLENKSILRERQAVMLVTKYTLFLASGLIVPSIFGLIIGLVNGLNFGLIDSLEIGLSVAERTNLFSFSVLGANIYIIEFTLLSSFFLALQENNKKQFWVFAFLLCPIALICFFIAQTFI